MEIEVVNELKKRVKGYARAESLQEWLTDPFFDFHCDLYQQRPILWNLASSQDLRPIGRFPGHCSLPSFRSRPAGEAAVSMCATG